MTTRYSTLSLIAYMSNLILASVEHKQKVETMKSYMRHRKIPSELQTRIEEYLDYLWTTQKGLDESTITSMLPVTHYSISSLFCNSRIIYSAFIRERAEPHMRGDCDAAAAAHLVPDDMIITRGDWRMRCSSSLGASSSLSIRERRAEHLSEGRRLFRGDCGVNGR